jgi:hypothetical protein
MAIPTIQIPRRAVVPAAAVLFASLLAGCANHPIDCAIGFYHRDCLPARQVMTTPPNSPKPTTSNASRMA